MPAAYDPVEPAALMRLQRRLVAYLDPEGEVRGGIVLDNLVRAVSEDPDRGASAAGAAAATAPSPRPGCGPTASGKVVAYLSSFAQMPDGNPYPALLPTVPRKPLRVLLQAGHRDLNWDQPEWNWLAENLRTAAALAEAGYDFRLVLGDGGHSANHGGVLLPDALRWVWRAEDADGAA